MEYLKADIICEGLASPRQATYAQVSFTPYKLWDLGQLNSSVPLFFHL